MRAAALVSLSLMFADVTPHGASYKETRWKQGDFTAAATESLDRTVTSGDVVGIKTSGRGESCLIRRQVFPFRAPCRLHFRMRWSDVKFLAGYPSLHVLFDPPALNDSWWKAPISDGEWTGGRPSFLFHFASDRNWRQMGMTASLESAAGQHHFWSSENTWVSIELRFDGRTAVALAEGRKVGECDADVSRFKTFTYGIGDQTSTFVELDEFRAEPGR